MNTAELIQAYFDTFNAMDVEGRLSLLSEDVRHEINQGSTEVGREAFGRFVAYMDERYREQIHELVVMSNGSRGAAEFTVNGEYLKTDGSLPTANGQRYSIPAAAFFETEDGKITRITSYYNLPGWIAAVSNDDQNS